MTGQNQNSGWAIALAWPETWCKQAGGWYEFITRGLGFSKNGYYKAGHAALVLVDSSDGACHYFDFGRYHAPYNHGRVRGAETDEELQIHTRARLSSSLNSIMNLDEILHEVQSNPACHGSGKLYASARPADFETAMTRAKFLQSRGPILYGPFVTGGTNCSRFVNQVLLKGITNRPSLLRLRFVKPLTPTPLNNVNALGRTVKMEPLLSHGSHFPQVRPDKEFFRSTLPAPGRELKIPESAQWLSGEGAGSWYHLEYSRQLTTVSRYSPDGLIESVWQFEPLPTESLPQSKMLTITYPTDARGISLKNGKGIIRLNKLKHQVE